MTARARRAPGGAGGSAGVRAASERGFALIVVMLVMALVGILGAEFAFSMRLEASAVRAYKGSIIGAHLAEAALAQASREILADAASVGLDDAGLLTFYGADRRALPHLPREKVEFPGGHFSYRITDEEARLNVNTAPPDRIDRLLQKLGVEREVRDVVRDSLQDWRDSNDEHRLNGAESDYYLKLPVPYRAHNTNLVSVAELLQIRGVTREIYAGDGDKPGLANFLSVKSSGQVNINTASPTVLAALGLSDAEIGQVLQTRALAPYGEVPGQFGARGLGFTTRTFRVEAEGLVDGRVAARLTAVVQKRPGTPPSLALLEWSGAR
jgi:general secretion pathway protein K